MNKIKELYFKHQNFIREFFIYGIFGVLTTVVSYAVYAISAYFLPKILGIDELTSTIPTAISWVAGVLFSYFTNRKWVFDSSENTSGGSSKQFISFVSSRVLSGVIDIIIMFIFVDIFKHNEYLVKLISNVIVVILNYIFSKLFVFKKAKPTSNSENSK